MKNIQKSSGRCPICGKLLIQPLGNPASTILLVGDYPGHRETIERKPFVFRRKATETRTGDILQQELNRVGITLGTTLLTNLWMHQKPVKLAAVKKKKQVTISGEYDLEACPMSFHLDQLIRLLATRTHVLLMGSEVVSALTGHGVGELSGLQVEIPPFNNIHFWVSPNPSSVFGQPIGELRLAFQRFSEDVHRSKK